MKITKEKNIRRKQTEETFNGGNFVDITPPVTDPKKLPI